MAKDTVLFVDDEVPVLNSIKRAVIDEEYASLFATSASEALRFMQRHKVNVIVTDLRMPGMDGLTLLKQVKEEYPDTIRIVLSGYALLSLEQVLAAINQGDIFRFITKPWHMEEDLLVVIRRALDYYNLQKDRQDLAVCLHQRNKAYKNVLYALATKASTQKDDMESFQQFLLSMLLDLEREHKKDVVDSKKILVKLQIARMIADDYFKIFPITWNEFLLTDLASYFKQCILKSYDNLKYSQKIEQTEVKCVGNSQLILMILSTIARLISYSGQNRAINYLMTSQRYEEKSIVQMRNVIEFGYVDGAVVLIDKTELLTHEMLSYFISLLGKIGQPFGINVTYTYVNQNTSLISVEANLLNA